MHRAVALTRSTKKEKAVVTPDWLRDSARAGKAAPCGDYAALRDLHDSSVIHCPDADCGSCDACGSSSPMPVRSPSPSESRKTDTEVRVSTDSTTPPSASTLDPMSPYACQRASPLVCPNQALVDELAVIRRSRELEGEDRSALSYQRAIAVRLLPSLLSESHHRHLFYILQVLKGENGLSVDACSLRRAVCVQRIRSASLRADRSKNCLTSARRSCPWYEGYLQLYRHLCSYVSPPRTFDRWCNGSTEDRSTKPVRLCPSIFP